MTTLGLINPGEMGASVGAAALVSGARVIWAGRGRSDASHRRAADAGLTDCRTMSALCEQADMILSICPPHDAEAVATEVSTSGFAGLFADCNAIAPQKSRRLSRLFPQNKYVDGGIIGGPAWKTEYNTQLYLSGKCAPAIADIFKGSPLHTQVLSEETGAASAIKMVFAANTKGSLALLAAVLGVAEKEGVRKALEDQWGEQFSRQAHGRLVANSAKAWRFTGEMQEIAATFGEAGFPPGFYQGAEEIFSRLARFKDDPEQDMDSLLAALLNPRL